MKSHHQAADLPASGPIAWQQRLYRTYSTQHAGAANHFASKLIYDRDIRPHLPMPRASAVLDIGCGQGTLVQLLLADGYQARGVDISDEQVSIAHAAGLTAIARGDFRQLLSRESGSLAAVTAIDFLEHLAKDQVLATFDLIASALAPGGVFIGRVPNAVSPFVGHIRHGDFTHELSFTGRSLKQLAKCTGFESVTTWSCPPPSHGIKSTARAFAWTLVSSALKFALAAETGQLRGHIVTQNLTFVARMPLRA